MQIALQETIEEFALACLDLLETHMELLALRVRNSFFGPLAVLFYFNPELQQLTYLFVYFFSTSTIY